MLISSAIQSDGCKSSLVIDMDDNIIGDDSLGVTTLALWTKTVQLSIVIVRIMPFMGVNIAPFMRVELYPAVPLTTTRGIGVLCTRY